MLKNVRKIYLILVCCLLSGIVTSCVSLRVSQQASYKARPRAVQNNQRQALTRWQIQGAFSLQQPNTKPILANYSWQQTSAQRFTLQISAPLRAVVVTIRSTPTQATMTQSGHPTITAPSVSALAKQQLAGQLHIPLPISQLYWWLRALPAPGQSSIQYDAYGHITQIQQARWNIAYTHYRTVQHIDLPGMLRLQSGQLRIKLVIKKWYLD